MSTGFYGWIREGVKRAVLMGVSDAVEQLGTPTTGDDISPQLLSVLRGEKTPLLAQSTAAPAPAQAKVNPGIQSRKRLGRTLGQVQGQATATADERVAGAA